MRFPTLLLAGLLAFFLGHTDDTRAEPLRADALYIFGDSLSDPGNLFALLGGLPGCPDPICPYFDGRYSNGPVWADYLAADFAASGQPFRNYAHGFARVVSPATVDQTEPATFLPINLSDQIARFVADTGGAVASNAVGIVWMGANDGFRIVNEAGAAFAAQGPGADPTPIIAAAAAAAQATAVALAEATQMLRATGLRNLVLMNLPDLGLTPLLAGNDQGKFLASLVSGTFNATLAALPFDGLNVTRIDIAGLFDALVADSESFGVSSLLNCFNQFDPNAVLCTDPDQRAFFDLIHPNRVIHARIAEEVRAVVAPVPLPAAAWLLLVGLGGLLVLRRRA